MHSLSTRLLTERKAIDCDVIASQIRRSPKRVAQGNTTSSAPAKGLTGTWYFRENVRETSDGGAVEAWVRLKFTRGRERATARLLGLTRQSLYLLLPRPDSFDCAHNLAGSEAGIHQALDLA
jgi:hypothetical protein